ncbi:MAG: Tfp pilus assembly protein FimT/FimU [Aquabacterium sp.]
MRAPIRRRRGLRGFTMVELIAVLMLLGIAMVTVLPRMTAALDLRNEAWRDQVLAAVRHAQTTARSHRRLVCAALGDGAVKLSIARERAAGGCDVNLPGPDGDGAWAREPSGIATSVSTGGELFMQPDGRITVDPEGIKTDVLTISIAGAADIVIDGETGLVR